MRADPDFTAYVVARWRPVVRVLVVLGQSVERAEDVAVASFARLMSDWGRLRREVDVDVELARVVLDGWVRVRGQQPAPRVPVTVPAARLLTQELEDQLALLERIVAGLDELDETTRVTVVLHHLGELDQDQVAEVLGMSRAEVGRRLSEAAARPRPGPARPGLPLGRDGDRRPGSCGGPRGVRGRREAPAAVGGHGRRWWPPSRSRSGWRTSSPSPTPRRPLPEHST